MPFRPEHRDGGRTIPGTTPPRDRHGDGNGDGNREDGSANLAGSAQPPAGYSADDSAGDSDALQSALPTLLTFSSFLEELRSKKIELARQGVSEAQIRSMVLQFIADRGLAISGASGIAIALSEGNDVVCRGSAGESAPPIGLRLNLDSGLTAICYTTGTVVRCDDSETDSRVDRDACRSLGIRSVVAIPLRRSLASGGSVVIGLIEAFDHQAFAFTDADIREFSLLSEMTVEAIKPPPKPAAPQPAAAPVTPLASFTATGTATGTPKVTPKAAPANTTSPPPMASKSQISFHGELAGQSTSLGDWTQLAGSPAEAPGIAPAVSREQTVSPTVPESSRRDAAIPRLHQSWKPWGFGALVVTLLAGAGATWHYLAPKPKEATVAPSAVVIPVPLTPAQLAATSALPRLTGVRHWANTDSSTVVIDLQDEVPYEIHKLASPDRIDVDFHDTALAKELVDKNDTVEDPLLSHIRVGQSVPGVSRVELETKSRTNYSVSLEPNPYRLIVELRNMTAPPKPKLDSEAAIANTVHPTFPEISSNPTAEDTKLRAHVPHLRIVIDAGHGGWDNGTVGRQGLLEKDLALEIAQRLGVLLEQRLGLEILYTRTDDTFVPLGRRAAMANQAGADLFISVHANYSSQPEARGVETYYTASGPSTQVLAEEEKEVGSAPALQMDTAELRAKSEASRKLATSVQQALYGSLVTKSAGVRNRGVKAASFVVLTGTTMPAILAEVSFVSSPTDEHNLQDPFYRQNIAEALYRGVARYAATTKKTDVAGSPKHNAGL